MKTKDDYRKLIERQAARLHRIGARNTSPRRRIEAQAARLAVSFADDPGAAIALHVCGATALAMLLRQRAIAADPAVKAHALALFGGRQ